MRVWAASEWRWDSWWWSMISVIKCWWYSLTPTRQLPHQLRRVTEHISAAVHATTKPAGRILRRFGTGSPSEEMTEDRSWSRRPKVAFWGPEPLCWDYYYSAEVRSTPGRGIESAELAARRWSVCVRCSQSRSLASWMLCCVRCGRTDGRRWRLKVRPGQQKSISAGSYRLEAAHLKYCVSLDSRFRLTN